MSTIIEKKVTPLTCQRCLHKWNYSGTNLYVATCPHCRTYVNVKKNRTKYKEVETEQSLNINTNEKKIDSFDNIIQKRNQMNLLVHRRAIFLGTNITLFSKDDKNHSICAALGCYQFADTSIFENW